MGMFDYVRSEVPLPDGFSGELQSKDFDCRMTTVLIRADGRLLIEDSEWEEVPRPERLYSDAEPGSLESIVGLYRTVNRRWRDLEYHGIFNFYGGGRDDWRQYDAKFTDGNLVEIGEPHP